MSVRNAGEPITAVALSQFLRPVSAPPIAPSAIRVGTRIAWIVQRAHRRRCGKRLEDRTMSSAKSSGKPSASFRNTLTVWLAEPTRANVSKKWAIVSLPRIGIEHDVASFIVDQAGREGAAILTASYLIKDPTRNLALRTCNSASLIVPFKTATCFPETSVRRSDPQPSSSAGWRTRCCGTPITPWWRSSFRHRAKRWHRAVAGLDDGTLGGAAFISRTTTPAS